MENAVRRCMDCRERAVVPVRLPLYSTEMEHDGRVFQLELADLDVLRCENCGSMLLLDAAGERIFNALRSAAGLLEPEEIRRQREALGLEQKELADLLQVHEGVLARWEAGGQLQQRGMDQFLRGFFAVEELRAFLGMRKPMTARPDLVAASPGSF